MTILKPKQSSESAQTSDQPTSTSLSTSRSVDLVVSSHSNRDSPQTASQTSKELTRTNPVMPWQLLLNLLLTMPSFYSSSVKCKISSTWDRQWGQVNKVAMRCKLCAPISISSRQAIIIQCLMLPRRLLLLEIWCTPLMINSISQSLVVPATKATWRNCLQFSEMQVLVLSLETLRTNSRQEMSLKTRPWHRHIRTRLSWHNTPSLLVKMLCPILHSSLPRSLQEGVLAWAFSVVWV